MMSRATVGVPATAAWLPRSPCTPTCLPAPVRPTPAEGLRVGVRLAVTMGILLVAVLTAPWSCGQARARWLRTLSRATLRAVGVSVRQTGVSDLAQCSGTLVVANHISWIDVLALLALTPARLVAKKEVADWPLVGMLARRAGTLFLDRAGLRELPGTVSTLASTLREGECVAVFPEGTTWCGAAAGRFHHAVFQAAVDAGASVLPIAITFRLADGSPARTAAFVGAQTLLNSILRVLRTPGLSCELTVLPVLAPGEDRRTLARAAERAISTTTGISHGYRTLAPLRPPPARPATGAHALHETRGTRVDVLVLRPDATRPHSSPHATPRFSR